MAEPWRTLPMVNKLLLVTFRPLRRLAAARLAGHSAENTGPERFGPLPKRDNYIPRAEFRFRQQPQFWRIYPCPTPSRSALSHFPPLPVAFSWRFAMTD